MIRAQLTRARRLAKAPLMQGKATAWHKGRNWLTPLLLAGPAALGGCISVNAPEEPIVIELNINIRQEVIYRLAADAGETIEENAEIF